MGPTVNTPFTMFSPSLSFLNLSLPPFSLYPSLPLYSSILSKAHEPASKAAVTALASGSRALWVVTKGGHLLAFDPVSADVLLVHRKKCSLSSLVCLSSNKLITFGEGALGAEEGEESQVITGMFTVWENYIQ